MISTVGLPCGQPDLCLMRWIAPSEQDAASVTLENASGMPQIRRTRDLLPRLLSGQIALDKIEAA